MSKKGVILLIILILGIISCLIGIAIATYFYLAIEPTKDYAVIFDAGSSGTRMYVYEWDSNYKPDQKQPLYIKQLTLCNSDDNGIDKIKDKEELGQKFSKCINEAYSLVPENRKNRTKISLAATAGMRLLQINSQSISNQIFSFVREYFKSTGFLFTNDSQVKTISGREEAINAWISANYFEKNFNMIEQRQSTRGIIDLGGASTQVVFVPQKTEQENSRTIRIFGVDYQTYSQSFLCYGINEAKLMYEAGLLKQNSFSINNKAECFPRDSTFNLTKLKLNKSPCTNGNIYKEQYSSETFQRDYIFNGNSNYTKCVDDVRSLFNKKQNCQIANDSCSFANAFIADVKSSKFLAFSSFWYAMNQTNRLWNSSFENSLDSFKEITKKMCSMSLNELIAINKTNQANIEKNRLSNMCFSNVYVIELLAKYGFDTFDNIKIVDKINGYSVGWTLGYLINELNNQNYLPYENIKRKLPLLFYLIAVIGLSLISVLLLVIILAMLVKTKRKYFIQSNI